MARNKTNVLILGGGFGGIKTALELAGHEAFDVTLLSDQENFRYYPTLYRTATGGSEVASSIPLAEIFKGKGVHIVKETAQSIDRQARIVKTKSSKKYAYDVLIVALGVVTNFFGIKGLDKYAYGIKTVEEAHRLRDHLHKQLVDEGRPDINYVVIGGGPTGVELAGGLPGYINHIMKRHGLAPREIHVDLVEAEGRVLPRLPKAYSKAVQNHLRKLGVILYLGQTVQAETAEALMVSGHPIDSHTVVWTAGVTNHPFLKANNFALNEHGKVQVDDYLQAEPGIYIIGDNAQTKYSGMAQTALYDGLFLANNLKRLSVGKNPKPYVTKQPIYVTPAGPRWAAVLWGNTHIYGWLGWALRQAADFIGYHDYEPWWQASRHWLASAASQESCRICNPQK